MNRAQRRAYAKTIKNSKMVSICPECGNKSRFFTTARGEKDTVLKCEVCGEIIREGEELTQLLPPGVFWPGPLSSLDELLLAKARRVDKLPDDAQQIDTGTPIEIEGSVT